MKRLYILVAVLLVANNIYAQTIDALKRWAEQNPAKIELQSESFAQKNLTADEAKNASALLELQWREQMKQLYKEALENEVFKRGKLQMKFKTITYGEKPSDGRSLYISMHGGGATHKRVNDQQWDNQIRLYKPEEGVYVAPRAPWNDWNMWFKPGMDEFFEMLIQAAVATMDVNPDKVYLMGYSAGGDGAWRMAPRMADRWAAASMMAGHPGEASQVSLRNTPFMIWMGENDSAYDRNKLAVKHGAIMDSLQQADNEGYIHETHIIKGKGHWMDRVDAAAVPWMAQYKRNPYPAKVVWRQEEVTRKAFYWLSVPEEECRHKAIVVAEIDKNVIEISESDYSRLTIYLNDDMVDLNKPVVVNYKGKKVFKGKLPRTIANMARTLAERGDLRYMFPAMVEVELPKTKE
ncbi:MAG: dienelactone hydrolase family protein [Alistipes sp.]|nr:dienelactone hydrolase family protein [Alistipes sp.]MBR2628221.1 dienelactone hydrolase family protein [Alistipes sp.]